MTKAQIDALRREVEQMAAAGASRNEFREWADAYYFGMEDLRGRKADGGRVGEVQAAGHE